MGTIHDQVSYSDSAHIYNDVNGWNEPGLQSTNSHSNIPYGSLLPMGGNCVPSYSDSGGSSRSSSQNLLADLHSGNQLNAPDMLQRENGSSECQKTPRSSGQTPRKVIEAKARRKNRDSHHKLRHTITSIAPEINIRGQADVMRHANEIIELQRQEIAQLRHQLNAISRG